jgi:hypothetical protein
MKKKEPNFTWNATIEELAKLRKPDVSNNEALDLSDGVAFANNIEKKWMEYRGITNNEDAWSFKQWLVGK